MCRPFWTAVNDPRELITEPRETDRKVLRWICSDCFTLSRYLYLQDILGGDKIDRTRMIRIYIPVMKS